MASREGSPNKNKAFLLKRLQDMYGADFHPIMNMAKNANDFQKAIDMLDEDEKIKAIPEANKLWEGIAQYVEPKLKAVEISGDQDNPLTVKMGWILEGVKPNDSSPST